MQIFEKKPTATKNYGIWVRYQSRTGYHNMYKEYRDLTLNGAVEQMYTEMASRHRVRSHQLHIIKTTVVKAADCKRVNITQFHDSQIKFPVLRKCDFCSLLSGTPLLCCMAGCPNGYPTLDNSMSCEHQRLLSHIVSFSRCYLKVKCLTLRDDTWGAMSSGPAVHSVPSNGCKYKVGRSTYT